MQSGVGPDLVLISPSNTPLQESSGLMVEPVLNGAVDHGSRPRLRSKCQRTWVRVSSRCADLCFIARPALPALYWVPGRNGRQIIPVILGGLRVSRAALCRFLMLRRCLCSPRVPSLNNQRFQPFFEEANNNRVKNTPSWAPIWWGA